MTAESNDVPEPSVQNRRDLLRQEQAEIERRRKRCENGSTWLGVLGFLTLAIGGVLYNNSPSSIGGTLVTSLAITILGGGAACMAVRRGRNPAWGLLSLVAYGVLVLLPDNNARRLDELEQELTGKVGTNVAKERRGLVHIILGFALFPFLKNYLGEPVRPDKRGVPPIVRPASTARNVVSPAPVTWAEGRHFRVLLRPGWMQLPRPGGGQGLNLDLALAHKELWLGLSLSDPISKKGIDGATLMDFAKIHQSLRQDNNKEARLISATDLAPDILHGKPAVRYELHLQTKEVPPVDKKYVIYIWESKDYFWAAEAFTIFDTMAVNREELRLAVENVATKHE